MIVATALVLLMTPGLAFFYGGMVRAKSVLNMMMMSFISIGTIAVIWVIYGYGLAFSPDSALGGFVEERMEASGGARRGRRHPRIEIEIKADRAALLGLEARQIAKLVPGDRACHRLPAVRFQRHGKLHEQEQSTR